ncbi:MAG: hypothetical protein KAR36_14135, partial [Candidatus Latescibacteria bacterium]|nr:hypothetical protein [Candidatus Latescibacterota bacterium]
MWGRLKVPKRRTSLPISPGRQTVLSNTSRGAKPERRRKMTARMQVYKCEICGNIV